MSWPGSMVVEWPSPGQGSGVRLGIGHCTQTSFSSECAILLGVGLGMWALHFSRGCNLGASDMSKSGPHLIVFCKSYWSLHVWNRKEAAFLSSVSRYLGLSSVFTSDPEYLALCHLWFAFDSLGVCGVGENKLNIKLVHLLWAASGASRSKLLADHYPGSTVSYVGSWVTLTRKTCGCFEHRLAGAKCGFCEGFFWCRFVLMLTLHLSVSQRVNNTTEPRRACW